MATTQIQNDVYYLAGRLDHRGANTESERAAAEYIRNRLEDHISTAQIDDFYSPDNSWYLFVSYYSEYVLVCLVAIWWPMFATLYGAMVFLAFFTEYMGYQVMGRFLPHYETQNVLAPMLNPGADRSVVFVAHYDSAKMRPFATSPIAPWMNYMPVAAAPLMLLVVATCVVQASGPGGELPPEMMWIRWIAVAGLVTLAVITILNEIGGAYTPGANDNASGTAALLYLAEHLPRQIIETCNVHFVATGSNQNWMSGARHFIRYHKLDKASTYVIVLDSVGRGPLRYTTRIGVLQAHNCDKELVAAAHSSSAEFNAGPIVKRAVDSDALPFLIRGYKAIEITAVPPEPQPEDNLAGLDYDLIARAGEFARTIIERVITGPS